MADFEQAVEFVLKHEGGLVVNMGDPGGTTNFGISQRSYPTLPIEKLTRDDAKAIYKRDYWRFDPVKSQRIANKLLDLAVNMGPVPAAKLLQESLRYFVVGPLIVDGLLGHQTISSIDSAEEEPLVAELKARAAVAHSIAASRPGMNQFLLGWIRRDIDG
ncbi:MAG TPA: glycosyl hydrolase 108 family protein [Candidatus Sulfopaludibacter sp.]|jgi:lysozyme family protein|nr:glycosyl hydrolase 108 family protein [Candidatus Sulfopaludibacter sp.]